MKPRSSQMIVEPDLLSSMLMGRITTARRLIQTKSRIPDRLNGNSCSLRRVSEHESKDDPWRMLGKRGNWESLSNEQLLSLCPYGGAGDFIFVRETLVIGAGGSIRTALDDAPIECSVAGYFYKQEGFQGVVPAIHTPKWASRLTLKISSVRVERILDIDDEAAIKSGAFLIGFDCSCHYQKGVFPILSCPGSLNSHPQKSGWSMGETQDGDSFFGSSRASYLAYWQAKYSRSLDFNDWVWVVEFEVIKSNVMQHL